MPTIGRIASLWRCSVKSRRAESSDEVYLINSSRTTTPRSRTGSAVLSLSALSCCVALSPGSAHQNAPKTGVHFPSHSKKASTRKALFQPFSSVKALERYLAEHKAERREERDKPPEFEKPDALPAKSGGKRPVPLLNKRDEGEKDESLDALGAYLYYLKQRAYPNDTIDWTKYPQAAAHRDKMPATPWGKRGSSHVNPMSLGSAWKFVGPNRDTSTNQWGAGIGAFNGRVTATAFVPGKPNTLLVGSAGGGLWQTTDGGLTWLPLSEAWPFMQISCITIDPSNSDTIYVGTGDFGGFAPYGFGIMKSVDGGQTWANLGSSTFGSEDISRIVVDPENPQVVVVSTGRTPGFGGSLWRSADGGATWAAVTFNNTTTTPYVSWSDLSISIKTSAGKRFYYATGTGYSSTNQTYSNQLWRSDDRGLTWTKYTSPATGNDYGSRAAIAASSTDANTVYLLAAYNQFIGGATGRAYRSTNGGTNWTNITATTLTNASWGQGWYDLYLRCGTRTSNNTTADVIYVGLVDILEYTSAGGWKSIAQAYTGNDLVHVDQHGLAVNPADANSLLVGNDGGVYLMARDAPTNTWSSNSLNGLIGISQIYRAAFHPTDPTIILTGEQDNGTNTSWTDLNNWFQIVGGDGGFCAINQTNPNELFGTVYYLSIDWWDGTQWTDISPNYGSDNVAFIAPITLDPSDQSTLYGGTNYLWRWTEANKTWAPRVGGKSLSTNGYIQFIAVAPSDSKRIYTGSVDGEVWMTTDKGATWTKITSGVTSLPNRAITQIEVHPTNPSRILVGLSGTGSSHLWRCDDTQAGAARTWTDVSGAGHGALPDIPLNTIALDLDDPLKTYYAGTDVGVFATMDGGATWTNATELLGLPNVQVNDLKTVAGTRSLYAATYGRGLWRIDLPKSALSLTLSSNAIKGAGLVTGTVHIPQPAIVNLEIALSSSLPKLARVPSSVTIPKGKTQATFPILVSAVSTDTSVTITAKTKIGTATANLLLRKR